MSRPLVLVLVDDAATAAWEPFALTRPASELLFGALTFRRRAELVFGVPAAAVVAPAHLVAFSEDGAPPVRTEVPTVETDRLLWRSRAVPDWSLRDRWLRERPTEPTALVAGDTVVGLLLPAGAATPPWRGGWDDADSTWAAWPRQVIPARTVDHVWQLVLDTPAQLAVDIVALHPEAGPPPLPAGVVRRGSHPVVLGRDVDLEPPVVLDTRHGPIWLDDGVEVRAFTRVVGPLYAGPGTILLGGPIGPAALGPVCRVRGEFAESVALGYVNKQHDGHIGHAYLGRWVNLGAGTTNSDLKNTYGPVRLRTARGEVDTGALKLGCFLGDHVRTAIGTLLNTGTIVGAASNLFGVGMPPKRVPPFAWGFGPAATTMRLDAFLDTARRVMARRGIPWTAPLQAHWTRVWQEAQRACAS
jgi:UDP-N-acetylglucosamine diphosphorylase/glucosamine-1-phosphate N-acetyltransferase